MAKQTVQGIILQRLDNIERLLLENIVPTLAGLKVKAAIAGGIAGIVGTALVSLLFSIWK